MSVMIASVVSIDPAIDAAFSSAHVVTDTGSQTPSPRRSSVYSRVLALKP